MVFILVPIEFENEGREEISTATHIDQTDRNVDKYADTKYPRYCIHVYTWQNQIMNQIQGLAGDGQTDKFVAFGRVNRGFE